MRRLAATAGLLLAFAAPIASAAHAVPRPRAAAVKTPGFPPLPAGWSHADVNVTIAGQSHTLELDRGVVLHATPNTLRIRERDNTTTDVALTRSTIVVLVGKHGRPADRIVAGMVAWTLRVDGGPAVRVRAGWGI